MSYTLNPHLPKVRAKAVELVRIKGWSVRQTARYIGVYPGTVSKWLDKAATNAGKVYAIPTLSSKPKSSPSAVSKNIVDRIVEIRLQNNRCAEIVHAQLLRENVSVSLSTVKRTLDRKGLTKKRSKWKKYHLSGERPKAQNPGNLVEIDIIHIMLNERSRVYIFTMIDCYSRWAYAKASKTLSALLAAQTVFNARSNAPFKFDCIQSDHGPEFTSYFSKRIVSKGMRHRLIRVRKPNDNAHVERFNRTIQEELKMDIVKYKKDIPKLNKLINDYMYYYNNERLHLGLKCKTPLEACETFPRS
ncbi:MAG: integrase core domain-containing protein [Patescibacteria group bacterium]